MSAEVRRLRPEPVEHQVVVGLVNELEHAALQERDDRICRLDHAAADLIRDLWAELQREKDARRALRAEAARYREELGF